MDKSNEAINSTLQNLAYKLLEKLDVQEQFREAIEAIFQSKIEQEPQLHNEHPLLETLISFYNENFIEDKLIQLINQTYVEEELAHVKDRQIEEFISSNPQKFKCLEGKFEMLYDQLYLEIHRKLSGIDIIAEPNQASPFSFFTVDREDGLYIVESYDSYLPQNTRLSVEPLIDSSDIIFETQSTSPDLSQVVLKLPENAFLLLQQHFNNHKDLPLAFIVNNKILSMIQSFHLQDNNEIVIPSF